ncbi:MAG: ion transporter [Planctomycetota bacterium]
MTRRRIDEDEESKHWGRRVQRALHRELAVERRGLRRLSWTNRAIATLILVDVVLRVIETEDTLREDYLEEFLLTERVFLSLFTLEFLLRVFAAGHHPRFRGIVGRLRFLKTYGALVDLAALAPSWITFGNLHLTFARALRGLLIIRFVHFGRFGRAIHLLRTALAARAYELAVSFGITFALLLLASTGMYYVEGDNNPEAFGSIPRALWWAVITITTVGYGDVVPVTPIGKFFGSMVALLSVVLVAVPTGLFASAVSDASAARRNLDK